MDQRTFDRLMISIRISKTLRYSIVALQNLHNGIRMLAQTGVLPTDAVDKAFVFGICGVVFGFAADEIQIKIHVDRVAGDAQIVEMRTKETDARDVADKWMFGMDLGNNAIRGNDVENVDVFNDACAQRIPAPPRLDFLVPRNLGVRSAVRDNGLKPVLRSLLGQVAAVLSHFDERMRSDDLLDWELDMS